MVKQKSGFIVTISSFGGKQYFITPAYGIGKAAVRAQEFLLYYILNVLRKADPHAKLSNLTIS